MFALVHHHHVFPLLAPQSNQSMISLGEEYSRSSSTEVGDTGRYNFGQKCVFWAKDYLPVLLLRVAIIWRPYFAPAFNPGDPIPALMLPCRSSVNCGYHGAYLRRPLGERHHYRDGGRLGNPVVGEETSPALVYREVRQDNGKRN